MNLILLMILQHVTIQQQQSLLLSLLLLLLLMSSLSFTFTTNVLVNGFVVITTTTTNPSSLSSLSSFPSSSSSLFSTTDQQATWEDIGRNLLNLRNAGVPDDILMMTRLAIPNLNKCEVRPKSLANDEAGRGLFATQDILKGDIVTCYPGDILLQPSGLTGVPDYLKEDDPKLRSLLTKYSIGIKDDGSYAIMGLPELSDDMAYVGHIINDGITKPPTCRNELQSYISKSNDIANVEHSPLENIHMVTIAKRNILKGEELYVFYGPIYWMDHKETWIGDDDNDDDGDDNDDGTFKTSSSYGVLAP